VRVLGGSGGVTYIPNADRQMLATAVRSVGQAEGVAATRAALRHLSDVACSWEVHLAIAAEPGPRERPRRRAA